SIRQRCRRSKLRLTTWQGLWRGDLEACEESDFGPKPETIAHADPAREEKVSFIMEIGPLNAGKARFQPVIRKVGRAVPSAPGQPTDRSLLSHRGKLREASGLLRRAEDSTPYLRGGRLLRRRDFVRCMTIIGGATATMLPFGRAEAARPKRPAVHVDG